ncbi:phage tail tube assembly chaperone [Weissella paramesenteroides]|uniref:phage tail tube assembly chaperone n=1 Tax=Weissella paramesenteroides TaxID=1249 RepID=UPI003F25E196
MKVLFKELQAKPFEVKGSVKNLKKTYAIQLKLANMQEASEQNPVESLKSMMEALNELSAYIVDILHLSKPQQEKLEDLSQDDLMRITRYLNMRLMGMSDGDIEKAQAEADEDGEGLA